MILLQPCYQRPEFMIRVGNLAIVEVASVLRAIRLRRIVRAVRIVEVQPEKERPPRSLLQPCDRMRHAFSGAAIHQSRIFLLERLGGERIVVEIKAARQSPASVEHERADHRPGRISSLLERLRHGAKLRRQRLPGEILHAVLKRIGAGQNHGVRRPRQRHLRDRPLKHHAVMRQRIQRGSLHVLRAVASHVIGAQRIDGDQYDAGLRANVVFAAAAIGFFCAELAVLVPGLRECEASERQDSERERSVNLAANERWTMRLLRRQLPRAPRLLVCLGRESFGGQRFRQRFMHRRLLRRQLNRATQLGNRLVELLLSKSASRPARDVRAQSPD